MTKTRDIALDLLLGFWELSKKMHEMYTRTCGPVHACVPVSVLVNSNQDVIYM